MDVSNDPDIFAEKEWSLADDEGINTRELVKDFCVKASKESKSKEPILKRAVKGVSYGMMSILAGEYATEYGEIALDRAKATGEQRNLDHLYQKCNVSYCPQFNALFPRKTVESPARRADPECTNWTRFKYIPSREHWPKRETAKWHDIERQFANER